MFPWDKIFLHYCSGIHAEVIGTKDSSLQKIRLVGSQLPCVKPEEVILLTDEWRIYAETDIPEEWIQQEDGSVVRVDHYWHKVLQLKTPLGKRKFDVLAKTVKCALSLSHGNADNERSVMTDNISCSTPTVPLKKTECKVDSLTIYCETLFHNKFHVKNCSLSPTYSIPKIKLFAQLKLKQKVSQ